MDEEESGVKMKGYLQHKGKKRLISMWRRWYCVLNGHLLLFYRSESDFKKLGKFHEQIDLGLVYDVLPALGVENGIQISTHTGPHWLRCSDEKSCQQWLETLRASIVLRRESSIRKSRTESMTEQKHKSSARTEKAKSSMPDCKSNKTDEEVSEKKLGGPLSRLSLSFIPGHGKKYSTYDSHRSYIGTSEGNIEKWNSNDIKTDKPDEVPQTPGVTKRNNDSRKLSRPISESVSDFLLLNVHSNSENKSNEAGTGSDHVEIVRKKGKLHAPKLPASFNIGKMLSHLEVKGSGNSKSLNSLLEVPNTSESELQKRISEIEKDIVPKPVKVTKSEDTLAKRASEIGITHRRSIVPTDDMQQNPINDQATCPQESQDIKQDETDKKDVSVEQGQPGGSTPVKDKEQEETTEKRTKDKKNKDPTRRKSGLAMLKQFFQSAKISIRRKGDKSDRLSVTPNRSRKNSKDEKTSARSSLNMDTDQQQSAPPTDPVAQQPTQESPCVTEPTRDRIPKVTFQRFESHISEVSSEEVQSVREENFVSESVYHTEGENPKLQSHKSEEDVSMEEEKTIIENDYTDEATVVEICEPEQEPEQEEPEQVLCPITVTEPDRKSNNSVSSLVITKSNRTSLQEPQITSEATDEEVTELTPPLPIKMKTKCPSPGYDVPRSQPIPIEVDVIIKETTRKLEESTPIFEQIFTAQENIVSSSKNSDLVESPSHGKSPEDSTPPTSLPSTTLVRKRSQLEIEISDPTSNKTDSLAVARKHSQTSVGASNRISFALTETESVDEETVQILETESLHSPEPTL